MENRCHLPFGIQLLAGGLGAGGFILAAGALAMTFALMNAGPRVPAENKPVPPAPAVADPSSTWERVRSDDPGQLAANLRGLGFPEAVVARLLSPTTPAPSGQITTPDVDITASSGAGTLAFVAAEPRRGLSVTEPSDEASGNPAVPNARVAGRGGAAPARTILRGASFAGAAAVPAGGGAPMAAVARQPDPAAATATIVAPQGDAGIPVAFEEPSPDLPLDSGQKEQWKQVQDQFIKAVGNGTRDPKDPAYRQLWDQEQWLADQRFAALFGHEAFLQQQLQANKRSNTATAP